MEAHPIAGGPVRSAAPGAGRARFRQAPRRLGSGHFHRGGCHEIGTQCGGLQHQTSCRASEHRHYGAIKLGWRTQVRGPAGWVQAGTAQELGARPGAEPGQNALVALQRTDWLPAGQEGSRGIGRTGFTDPHGWINRERICAWNQLTPDGL